MKTYEYFQIMIPIVGFLSNMIVQVSSIRLLKKAGMLKSIVFGFISGICVLLILEYPLFFKIKEFIYIGFVNLIIYTSLGYCYFHFVNLGETARRIRILREIYDSESGLTQDEIVKRYNSREIIDRRLERLLDNGQVIRKNGRLYIGKPVVLLIAKIILFLKIFIIGKKSEFD
jgi:hypothetical protein